MVTTVTRSGTLVTVEQLLEMHVEFGRLELWEGEVVEVSPTGGPHAFVVARLSRTTDDGRCGDRGSRRSDLVR